MPSCSCQHSKVLGLEPRLKGPGSGSEPHSSFKHSQSLTLWLSNASHFNIEIFLYTLEFGTDSRSVHCFWVLICGFVSGCNGFE